MNNQKDRLWQRLVLLTFPSSLTTRSVLMTSSDNALRAEVMCICPGQSTEDPVHTTWHSLLTVTSNYLDSVDSTQFGALSDSVEPYPSPFH